MEKPVQKNKFYSKKIIPDYLSIDYSTYLDKQIELLKSTETFKDYNYEGSNVRLLLEWLSYFASLNTYYLNQIAKNVFDDSSDLYENMHRIAKLKGFNAKGYVSSWTNIDIELDMYDSNGTLQYEPGDRIYIPRFMPLYAADLENTSILIPFLTRESITFTITDDMYYNTSILQPGLLIGSDFEQLQEPNEEPLYSGKIKFNIPVIQGELSEFTYTGQDIVDNKLVLPFYNFNHDNTDADSTSTCIVKVNNITWTRVLNFYEKISGLTENSESDNVFQFLYDKFKRYVIEFSPMRNVPDVLDEIKISVIKSLGSNGNVGKNTISKLDRSKSRGIIKNLTKDIDISLECITLYNKKEASGGQNPQTMADLAEGGKSNISSQERCVNRNDFTSYLNARSDVIASNVWGEQEATPWGDVREYNKIHVSIIPYSWYDGTIQKQDLIWTTSDNQKVEIFKPIKYNTNYEETLKTYLEPRKMIMTYEVFDIPELIFFKFNIGLKLYRLYDFTAVKAVVLDKLSYYFSPENQIFNGEIDFKEIHNFILDTSYVVEDKNWDLIKGVENLVFRKIEINISPISKEKRDFYALPLSGGDYTINGKTFHTDKGYNVIIPVGSNIYPPNIERDYPQYTRKEFLTSIENKMKVIKLGFNQFPILSMNACLFEEEV